MSKKNTIALVAVMLVIPPAIIGILRLASYRKEVEFRQAKARADELRESRRISRNAVLFARQSIVDFENDLKDSRRHLQECRTMAADAPDEARAECLTRVAKWDRSVKETEERISKLERLERKMQDNIEKIDAQLATLPEELRSET